MLTLDYQTRHLIHTKNRAMIERVLVLSTAHISKETDIRLREIGNGEFQTFGKNELDMEVPFRFITNHQYGHIIFCSPQTLEEVRKEINFKVMLELYDIIEYALKNDCTMINIDADAEIINAELRTFKW